MNEKKIIILSEKIKMSEAVNGYPVLEVGKFASRKYSGVMSAKNPSLKQEPGIVEIKQDWIDAVEKNYKSGILETVPFIDEVHEEGISLGPITNVTQKDGKLILWIDWNERGKEYIKNNEYMYLSIYADNHTVSKDTGAFKMGETIYPVLHGAGICNNPVYKNQKTLQETTKFSEDGKPTGETVLILGENKISKGGIIMFTDLFTKLIEAIKAAMAGPDAETAKTEVQGILKELQGIAGVDVTASEKLAEDNKELKNTNTKLSEKIKLSEKTESIQLSELSIRLTESENRNGAFAERIGAIEFDAKYLHKKVTPANRDRYFKIFLSDKPLAESVLADLPELSLNDDAKGQDGDLKINGNMLAAETKFAEETKKIQARDSLTFKLAYEKCKVEQVEIWNKLTEGGK